MAFRYINNTRYSGIDIETIQLLERVDAFPYAMIQPRFNTLGDLHNILTVEVVDDAGSKIKTVHLTIADIKKRKEKLQQEKQQIEAKRDEMLEDMRQRQDWSQEKDLPSFDHQEELDLLDRILDGNLDMPEDHDVTVEMSVKRSGYYTRSGNCARVVLEYADKEKMAITYIHEMMHAYYDSLRVGYSPNMVEYAEEPLAEYGMLHFLAAFVIANLEYCSIFQQALTVVKKKQERIGLAHYGFGEYLYRNYADWDWETKMRAVKGIISTDNPDYQKLQSIFQSGYPHQQLSETAHLLYDILRTALPEETNDGTIHGFLEAIVWFPYALIQPKFNSLGDLRKTLTVEIVHYAGKKITTVQWTVAEIRQHIKELHYEKIQIEARRMEMQAEKQAEAAQQAQRLIAAGQSEVLKDIHLPLYRIREQDLPRFNGGEELYYLEHALWLNSGKPDDYVVTIEMPVKRDGYYTRSGQDAKVVLERNDIDKMTITYIREMMHAYYDSDRLGDSPNVIEYIEDPLAEYGMLHFFEALSTARPEYLSLFQQALTSVQEKQKDWYLAYHGFGEYLYRNYAHLNWETKMRAAKNKISRSDINYRILQTIFQSGYPEGKIAADAAQLLDDIL